MKNTKGYSVLLLLQIIVGALVVSLFLYYSYTKHRLDGDIPNIVEPYVPAEDLPLEVKKEGKFEDTEVPGQKKYTSEALGISFLYLENQGIENIVIEENGTRIYVYGAAYDRDSGQFVEVFKKDPNDSLVTALEKQFLTDYPKTDCEAYIRDNSNAFPASYEEASIRITGGWKDMDDLMARYGDCPDVYTESNGISYFVADSNHPDKFVFFRIGQYGIAADPDQEDRRMWQDTIEFLN